MSVLMNTIVFEDCRNQWSVSRPLLGLILLNEKVSKCAFRKIHRRKERLLDTDDHGIESWGLDNPEVLPSKASGLLQLAEATEAHTLHCVCGILSIISKSLSLALPFHGNSEQQQPFCLLLQPLFISGDPRHDHMRWQQQPWGRDCT